MAFAAKRAHRGTSRAFPSNPPMPTRLLSSPPKLQHQSLAHLPDGPYFILASMLDAATLCCMDASCRLLGGLNRANIGPWRQLGATVFRGLELDRYGPFEEPGRVRGDSSARKLTRIDWKSRLARFHTKVQTFRRPFSGNKITSITQPDEIAYFKCQLCTDVLEQPCSSGCYFEVEVVKNPNNLSMAVVDFQAGGCSSVTFSPDAGAVIRESKIQEAPRKVEGVYIQPLQAVPPGRPFHGFMGLYLHQGKIAFFRRIATGPTDDGAFKLGPWETTGLISDFCWAAGRRLTPCLAFRDEGAYHVRFTRFGNEPPVQPEQAVSQHPQGGTQWKSFDWSDEELEA